MQALVLLLASLGGETQFSRDEFGVVAIAVGAVFCIILAIIGAWAVARRNPPIETEIDERIDKKLNVVQAAWTLRHTEMHAEMIRLNQERRVTVANLFQKLEDYRKETKDDNQALRGSIQQSFEDLNYSIGRLEGLSSPHQQPKQ